MKCLCSGPVIITGACQQKYPKDGGLDEKCICSLEYTKSVWGLVWYLDTDTSEKNQHNISLLSERSHSEAMTGNVVGKVRHTISFCFLGAAWFSFSHVINIKCIHANILYIGVMI